MSQVSALCFLILKTLGLWVQVCVVYPCVCKCPVYVQGIFRSLYFPLLVQRSMVAIEERGEVGCWCWIVQ